eukprot:377503-Pyramimonas_sp.AAC.1
MSSCSSESRDCGGRALWCHPLQVVHRLPGDGQGRLRRDRAAARLHVLSRRSRCQGNGPNPG